jgi:hypothetical protein
MTSLNTTNAIDSDPQSIDTSIPKAWEHNHDDPMSIDSRGGAELDFQLIKGSYPVSLAMLSEHTEEFAAKMGTRGTLVCQSNKSPERARKHLGARP